MSDQDNALLFDMAERLLAENCTADVLNAAEAGHFPAPLWLQLSETGLLAMLEAEAAGGVEASPSAFAGVMRLAGRHGAPGPLAETLVARWLAGEAGIELGDGPVALPIGGWSSDGGTLCASVRQAVFVLAARTTSAGAEAALVPIELFGAQATKNIAGEPLLDITAQAASVFKDAKPLPAAALARAEDLLNLARAALIVGAIERVLALSVGYANERVQFGRPIGKFQAIQQQLASLAGAAAASSAILAAAGRELDHGPGGVLLAAARARVADAVDMATQVGHQVHGAIGITHEYVLHHFTRRLWAWRAEAANLGQARLRLADAFADLDARALWPAIVAQASG